MTDSQNAAARPRPGRGALVVVAITLLLIGAASAWAVATILGPTEDPLASTGHSFVAVEQGTVGQALNLNTMAEWSQQPIGTNRAAGVVTDVAVEAGEEVVSGAVLYTIDLQPVVIAQGAVPMFRPLGPDSAGPDVRQLQEMLRAVGQYDGRIDGLFGEGTRSAVSHWQAAIGAPATGVVDTGDVIFVPALPTRVTLDTTVIVRGATLSGGEIVVNGLSSTPTFEIPVTEAQAAMMPAGTRVEITAPRGETWEAVAEEQLRSDEGAIAIRLRGPNEKSICAHACAEITPIGKTALGSRIIVVEEVEGLVVPSAALVTVADGSTAVVDEEGRQQRVGIVASAQGMSVVTGVREGLRVQTPASGTARR